MGANKINNISDGDQRCGLLFSLNLWGGRTLIVLGKEQH